MKVIAYDRFRPGVTMDTIQPYLGEEVANVWRLWKLGVVRENYARADEPGVVIVFEVDSVETARRYVDDFPLSKAGLLEWFYIPLQAPLPLETLMDPSVYVAEPVMCMTAPVEGMNWKKPLLTASFPYMSRLMPWPFMSRAPRPQTCRSLIVPANGSTDHCDGVAVTTSM